MRRIDELGVITAFVVIVTIVAVRDPRFLSLASVSDLLQQTSYIALMAMGSVFLLAMRDIDLSVGAIYALSAVGAGLLITAGIDPWASAIFGIAIGVILGAANGILTNLLRVPTIVVTIGTLSMFRSLVLVVSGSSPIVQLPTESTFFTIMGGRFFQIPVSFICAVVAAVVLTIVFRRTRYGIMVRAIGSNDRAADFSGIPATRVRLYTLMLVGGMCGLAGVLGLAYFQSVDPTAGTGFELSVIAAAIVGGTSLAGGRGTVVGALFGAMIITVINSALVRFEVPSAWNGFVTGLVIVVAVSYDGAMRRRGARRQSAMIAPVEIVGLR